MRVSHATLSKSVSLSLTASDPAHPARDRTATLGKQFHSLELESDEESAAEKNGKKSSLNARAASLVPLADSVRRLTGSPVRLRARCTCQRGDVLESQRCSAGQESERMENRKALARIGLSASTCPIF